MDEKTWRVSAETWDASCFKKGVLEKQQSVPNTCDILPLKNTFFSELNRCIFQISLKYIKLFIPEILFIMVLFSFSFYFKITWPLPPPPPKKIAPPNYSTIYPPIKIKIPDSPQQRLFWNSVKHLWLSFFAKILNHQNSLTIFCRKLHHKYLLENLRTLISFEILF